MGRARSPARRSSCPTAERDGALGLGLFHPIFSGVRALMYNSYEERALINAAVGQRTGARRRGRGRFRDPGVVERLTIPPEVQHAGSIRHLRRADRREQGLQGAVQLLRALLLGAARRAPSRADRHARDPGSRSSADSPPRLRHRSGQVRRHRRVRTADHALVFRKPVDGRARGMGARPSRARQRQLRRPARPVPAQQCRTVLRAGSTSSSRPFAPSTATRRWPRRSETTAVDTSRRTTAGR